jgi:endonuclease YncB( thermonuclease family)
MIAFALLLFHMAVVVEGVVVCAPDASLQISHVVDGDTVAIAAPWLPGILGHTLLVRLLGIDTPEIHLAKCTRERAQGELAKVTTTELLSGATVVEILLCGWDKYGGRVLGDFRLNGTRTHLSQILLDLGLAVEYHGYGTKRDWCAAADGREE